MRYQDMPRRDDFEIFDIHCHVNFPQKIEETLEGFKERIKELNLDKMCILACPRTGKRENGIVDILENLKGLYLKEQLPIPVFTFAGFIYHTDNGADYVEHAKRMLEMGSDGFKTLEMHPEIHKEVGKGLNDPSLDPFFDFIGEMGAPMLCHAGNPSYCWTGVDAPESLKKSGKFFGPELPTLDEIFDEVEEILEKHPDVKFGFAHFFFMSDNYDRLVRIMDTYPNVYMDMTPGGEMFPNFEKDSELWRNFFIKYSKRILLGSDLYGAGYGQDRHRLVRTFFEGKGKFDFVEKNAVITALDLPDDILQDIYANNAYRFIGYDKPKKVNREMAYEYALDIYNNHYNELTEMNKYNLKVIMDYFRK